MCGFFPKYSKVHLLESILSSAKSPLEIGVLAPAGILCSVSVRHLKKALHEGWKEILQSINGKVFEKLSILLRYEMSGLFEIQNIKMTGYLHYLN